MRTIKILLLTFACLSLIQCASPPPSGPVTVIHDPTAARKLEGVHDFSLQWISWDDFGKAKVNDTGALWRISGRQDSKVNDDFITIDGVITEINAYEFKFDGSIVTRIDHIANGEAVTRTGPKTFRITGNRQYWRMMEMNNPRDGVVDYVDVFFDKGK